MAQEAFFRIHRKLDQYDERSKFSSWMFTVATRVFISESRKSRPNFLFVDDTILEETHGETTDPDTGFRDERVRRAVLALPEKYRNAINLFYFLDIVSLLSFSILIFFYKLTVLVLSKNCLEKTIQRTAE